MSEKPVLWGVEAAKAIAQSGLTIYEPIERQSPLFFDMEVLEDLLNEKLYGLNLAYPNRTRSKHSKTAVCVAMGYPVPKSFKKTQPRFPGQDLDVVVQKSDNFQPWNEEISPTRRYAMIRVDSVGRATNVRVVTGETLARLDRTGTLTQKYQAKRQNENSGSRLVSDKDTENFSRLFAPRDSLPPSTLEKMSPIARPIVGAVLTIKALYDHLLEIVGRELEDAGFDQERNRGAALHRLACHTLGLGSYADNGQFPDILCQALEMKLQTSPTIDLGLVSPDSVEAAEEIGVAIRHCDVRYAVAYADRLSPTRLRIAAVVLVTGESFFTEFQRFEGKIINTKLQIRLPAGFFR